MVNPRLKTMLAVRRRIIVVDFKPEVLNKMPPYAARALGALRASMDTEGLAGKYVTDRLMSAVTPAAPKKTKRHEMAHGLVSHGAEFPAVRRFLPPAMRTASWLLSSGSRHARCLGHILDESVANGVEDRSRASAVKFFWSGSAHYAAKYMSVSRPVTLLWLAVPVAATVLASALAGAAVVLVAIGAVGR